MTTFVSPDSHALFFIPAGVEQMLNRYRRLLLANVQAIRALGSCALNMCAVAAGRADLYYEGLTVYIEDTWR